MTNRLKLTSTAIDRLRDAGIYWDTQTPGLGVRVSDTGRKTYFYKRRVKGTGKERNISLGRHGDPVLHNGTLRSFPFGADDARTGAAAVLAQLLAGIDPVQEQERKEVEAATRAEQDKALSTTLREIIDDYLEHHRVQSTGRPLRPKTKGDYRDFMERHFEDWLDRPVAGIDRNDCTNKIREAELVSTVQAHKAKVYLRLFLNHAREMHADPKTGEPRMLAINPVTLTKKTAPTSKPKPRTRRIPGGKVGGGWLMLRRRAENPVKEVDRTGADWVSTLLLTGWRVTECAALEWSWIDFEVKTVTLPGDVDTEDARAFAGVKTHAEVTYPLSDALYEILKARSKLKSKHERYVFPSRAGSDLPHITTAAGTMRALARVTGCFNVKDGKTTYLLSPHDLRRTAEDAALACKVDYTLRLRLLNHKPSSQDVHSTSYSNDPSPEVLRPAVNAIANYILDAARVAEAQERGANVIPFPARAS